MKKLKTVGDVHTHTYIILIDNKEVAYEDCLLMNEYKQSN